MKLVRSMMVAMFFAGVHAAPHPGHMLAKAYIELIGEKYGRGSALPSECKDDIDALYAERCEVVSDDLVLIFSREDMKNALTETKQQGGWWKVTGAVYTPDNEDTTQCEVKFKWWTEKNGVFDIIATLKCTDDGKFIDSIKERVSQVYTTEEVS
jgi:hypothetical protein